MANKAALRNQKIFQNRTALESIENEIYRLSQSRVPTHMREVIETPSKLYLIAEYNKESLDCLGIKCN